MSIPNMNYPQYRKARRLTRECCNNVGGNCLLLDDGEECICVQSISYSLLCRWFWAAVLPLDAVLCAEITKGHDHLKRCCECGASFTPKSNRAKYCPACAKKMRRQREAEQASRNANTRDFDCLLINYSLDLPFGRSNRFKATIKLHIFYDRDIENIVNQQVAAKRYKNC